MKDQFEQFESMIDYIRLIASRATQNAGNIFISPPNILSVQFGGFKFNIGLFLGFVASCIACTTESLGEYYIAARICQEAPPSTATINRAVIFEGTIYFPTTVLK